MTAIRAVASHANEVAPTIAGALFDFLGFLTTTDEVWTFSSRHDASPAVYALEQWAEKRGLPLSEADVAGWSAALAAPSARDRDSTVEWEDLSTGGWPERATSSEAKQLREALEKARRRLEFAASMFDASNSSEENYSRDRAAAARKCRDEVDAIDSALSGTEEGE